MSWLEPVAATGAEVGHEDAAPGEGHIRLQREALGDALAVLGAEAVLQRGLEVLGRADARQVELREPGGRGAGGDETEAAGHALHAALAPHQGRAAAPWKARAWSGSSEVGWPQANAGMEAGPLRAAGFSASW